MTLHPSQRTQDAGRRRRRRFRGASAFSQQGGVSSR